MRTFSRRRRWNITITFLLAVAIVAIDEVYRLSMRPSSLLSGWTLLALIVLLAGYQLRKKLPVLPLGSSASWLQLHIYAGCLTSVLFAVHVGYRFPNGQLETVLAILYLGVFLSGIGGFILSRVLAARITSQGEEVIYERIPTFVRRIRDEVHQLVFDCISETETSMIPEFFQERLETFFARPRYLLHHLVHSMRPYQSLLLEIRAQDRYLNDREREVMREIEERYRLKNTLDYHYTLQATLKYWLFIHVPLTYALLIFAITHVILVYAYCGGI